jgi:hypothetical protein
MKPSTFFCFACLLSLLLLSVFNDFLSAQEVNAPAEVKDPADDAANRVAFKTERIVVFKDGYCMVIKRGKATTDAAGLAFTEDVPDAAVLGSFWASPTDGTIESMIAGWIDSETKKPHEMTCSQTIEIIEANVGKRCEFLIGESRIKGEIIRALTTKVEVPIDENLQRQFELLLSATSPNLAASLPADPTQQTTISRSQGDQFVLRTGVGDMLVHASEIRQLVISEMATTLEQTVRRTSRQKRLSWNFKEANQEVEIVLMYFRPGVRWIPTYRVDLKQDLVAAKARAVEAGDAKPKTMAQVSLQGEIINEAEDLIDMQVDVVVGVPNFRFRDVPSPLVLESVMRNALAQVAPQLRGQQLDLNNFSNAMYTQRASEFRSARAGGGEESAIDMPAELSGEGSNDLFVYHLQNMTLKKGERASVPILTTSVPYRDIYTWDIQLQHAESQNPANTGQSPLVLSENKVWRQVELINNTKMPWTTGAAMFVEGAQPLAQELLTYTSPGGICRVPVTVAVDLRGKVEDFETNRKLEDLTWNGYKFARINGQINIELANNKTVPVPVEVRIRFGGKVDEASDKGEIRLTSFRNEDWRDYRGDPAVNNGSDVLWTSTIEPEECFKPTLKYHFYVRH